MRRISSPTMSDAIVVLVFVSAMTVSAGIGNAQAEDAQPKDCVAAPNATSPAGQHWYYRIDRATHRHCWYLHAMMRGTHQAHRASVAANENVEYPTPAAPMPAAAVPVPAMAATWPAAPWPAAALPMPVAAAPPPVGDPPVAEAAPSPDNTPIQPNVSVLSVKTIAVRPPGAGVEMQSRHRAAEASISEAAARAYRAAPASRPEPTIFFFLLFGLGFVTFVTAIVLKRVAPHESWSWPVRRQARVAWDEERRNDAGVGPSGARPIIGSRRIDRRAVKATPYVDEYAAVSQFSAAHIKQRAEKIIIGSEG